MNMHWHEHNPIPYPQDHDLRVAWHLKHAANCGCRPIPDFVRNDLARRGIHIPSDRARVVLGRGRRLEVSS